MLTFNILDIKMKRMILRKIFNIATLFYFLFLLSMLSAQEVEKKEYSLKEAIDYALENNYDALNAKLSIEAANAQLREIVASGFGGSEGEYLIALRQGALAERQ